MQFSIIICTHNTKKQLPRTLDSLLKQICTDFEIIIIDGASTDGTVEIIKEYEKKFGGKMKWISEKDPGIYNAMNKGVCMAKGAYLNIVGAGDWLETNALEKAHECIKKNPQADAVHGKLRVWDKNFKSNYLLQSFPNTLRKEPMQHPALYYKKKLHDTYGLYDEGYKIVSDYLFCIKAFFIGNAVAIAFDDVVDNYVTDGISSTNTEQCKKETARALDKLGLNSLVSVIVPAYNQELYIAETLNSIAKQTYSNWECIIVDDGSTDKTADVVKKIIQRDHRFKYIKQQNLGPSAARNAGILHSHGEYILPLDSDDIISPRYIQDALDVFTTNPMTKLVYCKAEYFGDKSGEWKLPNYSYKKLLFLNMIFCSAMYRRIDYDKTRGYNINMKEGLEDWDFWLSFLKKGDIVYRIPKVHFFYRIKEASRNMNAYCCNDIKQRMYKQIFLNHEDKYRDVINPIYTESNINELQQRLNIKEKEKDTSVNQKNLFFNRQILREEWKNKICFVIFHPQDFIRKYFKKTGSK